MGLKRHCDVCDKIHKGGDAWMNIRIVSSLADEQSEICSLECLKKYTEEIVRTASVVFRGNHE